MPVHKNWICMQGATRHPFNRCCKNEADGDPAYCTIEPSLIEMGSFYCTVCDCTDFVDLVSDGSGRYSVRGMHRRMPDGADQHPSGGGGAGGVAASAAPTSVAASAAPASAEAEGDRLRQELSEASSEEDDRDPVNNPDELLRQILTNLTFVTNRMRQENWESQYIIDFGSTVNALVSTGHGTPTELVRELPLSKLRRRTHGAYSSSTRSHAHHLLDPGGPVRHLNTLCASVAPNFIKRIVDDWGQAVSHFNSSSICLAVASWFCDKRNAPSSEFHWTQPYRRKGERKEPGYSEEQISETFKVWHAYTFVLLSAIQIRGKKAIDCKLIVRRVVAVPEMNDLATGQQIALGTSGIQKHAALCSCGLTSGYMRGATADREFYYMVPFENILGVWFASAGTQDLKAMPPTLFGMGRVNAHATEVQCCLWKLPGYRPINVRSLASQATDDPIVEAQAAIRQTDAFVTHVDSFVTDVDKALDHIIENPDEHIDQNMLDRLIRNIYNAKSLVRSANRSLLDARSAADRSAAASSAADPSKVHHSGSALMTSLALQSPVERDVEAAQIDAENARRAAAFVMSAIEDVRSRVAAGGGGGGGGAAAAEATRMGVGGGGGGGGDRVDSSHVGFPRETAPHRHEMRHESHHPRARSPIGAAGGIRGGGGGGGSMDHHESYHHSSLPDRRGAISASPTPSVGGLNNPPCEDCQGPTVATGKIIQLPIGKVEIFKCTKESCGGYARKVS